jgi:hypothetical protein
MAPDHAGAEPLANAGPGARRGAISLIHLKNADWRRSTSALATAQESAQFATIAEIRAVRSAVVVLT